MYSSHLKKKVLNEIFFSEIIKRIKSIYFNKFDVQYRIANEF